MNSIRLNHCLQDRGISRSHILRKHGTDANIERGFFIGCIAETSKKRIKFLAQELAGTDTFFHAQIYRACELFIFGELDCFLRCIYRCLKECIAQGKLSISTPVNGHGKSLRVIRCQYDITCRSSQSRIFGRQDIHRIDITVTRGKAKCCDT